MKKTAHVTGFVQYSDYVEREAKTVSFPILRTKPQMALLKKNKKTTDHVTGVHEIATLELIRQLLDCERN